MNYYNDIVGEIHIFQLSKGREVVLQQLGNFLTFTGETTEEKTKYGVKLFEVLSKNNTSTTRIKYRF